MECDLSNKLCHPKTATRLVTKSEFCFGALPNFVISTEGAAVVEKPAVKQIRPQISQKKQIENLRLSSRSVVAFKQVLRLRYVSLRMTDHYVYLQSADQKLALIDHLRRQMVVQLDKQLLMADDLFAPRSSVDLL